MSEVPWKQVEEVFTSGGELVTSSRLVKPGDVFVALPGSSKHGAEFLSDALSRGASFALVPRDYPLAEEPRERLVPVEDIRAALGELARLRYGTSGLPFTLLGVTGTNGKTTVSYLLEHLLQRAGFRVGLLGTISYRWPGHQEAAGLTTPDCPSVHGILSRMAHSGVDVACMEVSSHALQQDRVAGLCFDAALFTNLSPEHLDYHGSLEDYFASKSRLFTHYLSQQGTAVINLDDAYGRRLQDCCSRVLGYTLNREAAGAENTLRAKLLSADRKGVSLQMEYASRSWRVDSPLIGKHNASNLLAVQAAGLTLGLGDEDFACLSEFQGVPGRLEWVANDLGLDVFVDYAHTPDALQNLLSAVRELDYGRILVVFGCGGDRDREKRPQMGRVVAQYADIAFLTSDNPRHEEPEQIMREVLPGMQQASEVIQEPDRREAIRQALQRLQTEDVLLLVGKGHESFQQIGEDKYEFNDMAVARECLSGCK